MIETGESYVLLPPRWSMSVGEPELTDVPLTAEQIAVETEAAFRQRVNWWGG